MYVPRKRNSTINSSKNNESRLFFTAIKNNPNIILTIFGVNLSLSVLHCVEFTAREMFMASDVYNDSH